MTPVRAGSRLRVPGRSALAVISVVVVLTGCSSSISTAGAGRGGSGGPGGGTGASAAPAVAGDITVLAAASLTETFTELGQKFEAAHPGTKVTFSFGSSATLATQITGGAPADVFASASAATMDTVVKAGAATAPTVIAQNRMEIATPPRNPKQIATLADLARPGVKVALCQAAVPCGVAAAAVLTKAGVELTPVTLEADVKSTLAKVESDEVDAGIVYVSDVESAGAKVTGVPLPDASNVSTAYPVALLEGSRNKPTAQAFVDYVRTPAAFAVLKAAGFLSP